MFAVILLSMKMKKNKSCPRLFGLAQASQAHCTNVWGRELSGKDYALAFVNNGVRTTQPCFGLLKLKLSFAFVCVFIFDNKRQHLILIFFNACMYVTGFALGRRC